MKIGLALGMGGARGWCHIGVLRALAEMGIVPDCASGCSMGALVGAAWSGDRLGALQDWALGLTAQSVLWQIDLRLWGGGPVEGREVTRLLEGLDLPQTFAGLRRPFGAVATDLGSGQEAWFESGPLLPAVRASIGIPGVFSPLRIGDRWYLDGALTNPVPVSGCRSLGADTVIAVNPNATLGKPLWTPQAAPSGPGIFGRTTLAEALPAMLRLAPSEESGGPPPPNYKNPTYFEVLATAIDIMCESVMNFRLAQEPPDLSLEVDLRHVGVLELHRAEEAIAAGRAAVEAKADEIARLAAASKASG